MAPGAKSLDVINQEFRNYWKQYTDSKLPFLLSYKGSLLYVYTKQFSCRIVLLCLSDLMLVYTVCNQSLQQNLADRQTRKF